MSYELRQTNNILYNILYCIFSSRFGLTQVCIKLRCQDVLLRESSVRKTSSVAILIFVVFTVGRSSTQATLSSGYPLAQSASIHSQWGLCQVATVGGCFLCPLIRSRATPLDSPLMVDAMLCVMLSCSSITSRCSNKANFSRQREDVEKYRFRSSHLSVRMCARTRTGIPFYSVLFLLTFMFFTLKLHLNLIGGVMMKRLMK